MPVNARDMDAFVGMDIAEICGNGYNSPSDNHCAHFVSHAAGLSSGLTCKKMKGGAKAGASIRVQELFSRCVQVGAWVNKPGHLTSGLVFVTAPGNVDIGKKFMANVPRKHVGVFIGDTIWHYSNSKDEVVTQTPDEFVLHYKHQQNALFFGSFPP